MHPDMTSDFSMTSASEAKHFKKPQLIIEFDSFETLWSDYYCHITMSRNDYTVQKTCVSVEYEVWAISTT